jgi:hypothetical protein
MDWIPSLLKHLSISRSAVVAVLITAVTLYVGPKVAPTYFDAVPAPWSILVQAALVFSGCLVLFWAWSSTVRSVSKTWRKLMQLYRSKNLDENEAGLLFAMGQYPSDPLNIERINFQSRDFPLSELELLHILNGLTIKGLVSRNPFTYNLFSLTDRGRQVALDITRSSMTEQRDEG